MKKAKSENVNLIAWNPMELIIALMKANNTNSLIFFSSPLKKSFEESKEVFGKKGEIKEISPTHYIHIDEDTSHICLFTHQQKDLIGIISICLENDKLNITVYYLNGQVAENVGNTLEFKDWAYMCASIMYLLEEKAA